jgi:hypothetical protein
MTRLLFLVPNTDRISFFGVHADGGESGTSFADFPTFVVSGKEGSGVINLTRAYLLWAAENGYSVVTLNADEKLRSALDYTPAYHRVELDSTLLYVDINTVVEAIKSQHRDGADNNVLFLTFVSDVDTLVPGTTFKVAELTRELEDIFTSGLTSVVVSEDVNGFKSQNSFSVDTFFGIVGDVTGELARQVTGNELRYSNPRGVLLIGYNGTLIERVNTYVVPRYIWDEIGQDGPVNPATGFQPTDAAAPVTGFVSQQSFIV